MSTTNPTPDKAAILAALAVMFTADDVIELRAFQKKKRIDSGYFDSAHWQALADSAEQLNTYGSTVCVTLNPVDPQLLGRYNNRIEAYAPSTTTDKQIVRRRWVMVDLDPVRPSQTSATDVQLSAAETKAQAIYEHLQGLGWPAPVVAKSGNGYHLLYAIDLPNDSESGLLVKGVLKYLSDLFADAQIGIDQSTADAAQLIKIYGTVANKGDNTPGAPWRLSTLVSTPARELVTVDQLRMLQPTASAKPQAQTRTTQQGAFNLVDFLSRHGLDYSKDMYDGGERYKLKTCPFNSEHVNGEAAVLRLGSGAFVFKCQHDSCSGNDWKALREHLGEPRQQRAPRWDYEAFNSGAGTADKGATPPRDDVPLTDDQQAEFEQIKSAVMAIPVTAFYKEGTEKTPPIDAAKCIGYALCTEYGKLNREAALTIAKEWDAKTGGDSTGEFMAADPDYAKGKPIGKASVFKLAREHGWTPPEEAVAWETPIEIVSDLPQAPEFDASVLLPKALADFVLDEADRMPCSPDYIAAALIVCLGSVIGASCALKPKRRDDWIVVPNLWGGIVGEPSSKKSPALSTVTRFIVRLATREAEKLVEAKKVFEAEQAAYEAHQGAVKANMKKAATGKPDALKMAASVNDLLGILPPGEPHARRYMSNDASVQKLCDIEASNPQGLMVFRDELVGLLASWECEGHEGDRAYYLEGWNGTGSYNSDRIGRGEQFVKNHCLSILGGIQPDKMETYLSDIASNLDNDGRVQRFQVMVYPNPVPWQWRDRYPVQGAREAVRDMFDRLSLFDPLQDGATPADDFVKLPHFYFDEAAQEIFIEWCHDLNLEQIVKEQDPLMKQHLGKYEKLFCSLALILHLAEGNIGHVKADSALRAASWCNYLAGHARRIYGMVEGAKVATAKMLLRRIQDGKLQNGFTLRTVRQKNWSGATNTIQIESALDILESHHWIKGFESVNGGRPTTTYSVNPALIGGAA